MAVVMVCTDNMIPVFLVSPAATGYWVRVRWRSLPSHESWIRDRRIFGPAGTEAFVYA